MAAARLWREAEEAEREAASASSPVPKGNRQGRRRSASNVPIHRAEAEFRCQRTARKTVQQKVQLDAYMRKIHWKSIG